MARNRAVAINTLLIIGLLSFVGLSSIIPFQVQIVKGGGAFYRGPWVWHVSPDLVKEGRQPTLNSAGATGSGGTPSYDLPGSSNANLLSRVYVFQEVAVPNYAGNFAFGFSSYGFGEMGGRGNQFGVMVCTATPGCPSSESPEQLIRFEISHCIQDPVCTATGWIARLAVATDSGQKVEMRDVEMANLSRVSVTSLYVNTIFNGETVTAYATIHFVDISFAIQTQNLYYVIQVSGITPSPSKLNGLMVYFAAACTTCNGTRSSYANIATASYTAAAPILSILETYTPGVTLVSLSTIAIVLLVLGLTWIKSSGRLSWITSKWRGRPNLTGASLV